MPTAVGPNTKGEENLVFGYDLGDVSNSYKGEPTENLVTNPTFLGTSGTQTSAISQNWNFSGYSGDTGFKFHNSSTSPIPLKFPNEGAVVSTDGNDTSNRRIYYNGTVEPNTTYTLSYWVYSSVVNSITNFFFIYQADNSDAGSTSIGHPITAGEWVFVEQSFTTTSTTSNTRSVNWGPVISRTLNTLIALQRFQIEAKSHATPFVNGTRSATQGLIDLTGNSTIDLTNVSFDSNAQMTFDGTDDEISIANVGVNLQNFGITFEMVWKQGSIHTSSTFGEIISPLQLGIRDLGVGPTLYFQLRSSTIALRWQRAANDAIISPTTSQETGVYNLFTGVLTNTGVSLYKNGELVGTTSHSKTFQTWYNNTVEIGTNAYNTAFDGDIPLTKIYNRALTASEIKANYNAIKGRFNI